MLSKIKQTSVPVAALFLALCLVVGVGLGNRNALARAVAEAKVNDAKLPELSEKLTLLAAERVTHAGYLLRLCQRDLPNDPVTKSLEAAIEGLHVAKNPSQIAKADQELTYALAQVDAPLRALGNESVRDLLVKETDMLNGFGKQLYWAGADYNRALAYVKDVHGRLPLKWFLGNMPEVYR